MRRSFFMVLAVMAQMAFFGTVQAADDTSARDIHDWSGPYFGVKFGGTPDAKVLSYTLAQPDNLAQLPLDGLLGGTMSGYNFQHGNIVFGLDSDFAFTDISASSTSGVVDSSISIDTLSTVRGRIGWAQGNGLFFVTGGLAMASVDSEITFLGSDNNNWYYGWVAGGGFEWALNESWTARLEYQHIDLGAQTLEFSNVPISVELTDIHLLRAGVSLNTGFIWDAVLGR